jgi:AcrR family transcriptional regulator
VNPKRLPSRRTPNLLSGEGAVAFTIDAIAAGADVARMTVYNQFGSKRGVIEALSEELAERGGIKDGMPRVLQAENALSGLEILVDVFTHFWWHERLLLRRLRAVIALDPICPTETHCGGTISGVY